MVLNKEIMVVGKTRDDQVPESAWWFPGSRAEETENKVQLLFLGKNYTQLRTALHRIASSPIRTAVLKKKKKQTKKRIVLLRIRFCVVQDIAIFRVGRYGLKLEKY